MNLVQRIWSGITMAANAFVETAFRSGGGEEARFESYDARRLRYDLYWSYYTGHQYDSLSSWFAGKRVQKGFYRYIRNIYNPIVRLGDFWSQAIWRGALDEEAGNTGAIPIDTGDGTDEATLRAAIAQINSWSNWSVNMTTLVLRGTVLGDTVIYNRVDPVRRQVRMELLHPCCVVAIEVDDLGFTKSYKVEYERMDNAGKPAKYTEVCRNNGGNLDDSIVFETFRDDRAYAWAGNPGADEGSNTWVASWGFVPLVFIQHKNVGMDFGLPEFHAQVGKIDDCNDLASATNDRLRIAANPPWWVNGKKPTSTVTIPTQTPTTDNPQPEREQEKIIYSGDPATSVAPMVAPVDIASSLASIDKMLKEIEDDLPELKQEVWGGGAGPSDKTILEARGRVEGKITERRKSYDSGYVRAVQMAITMAAMAGYDGFGSFNRDSYANDKLDFSVSERPGFPPQPSEVLAQETAFWTGWAALEGGEVPFPAYAASMGKSKEWIDDYVKMRDAKKLAQKTSVTL